MEQCNLSLHLMSLHAVEDCDPKINSKINGVESKINSGNKWHNIYTWKTDSSLPIFPKPPPKSSILRNRKLEKRKKGRGPASSEIGVIKSTHWDLEDVEENGMLICFFFNLTNSLREF